MAGALLFYLKDGKSELGKKPGQGGIRIKGLGLEDSHAIFTNNGNNELSVKPVGKARILVNG